MKRVFIILCIACCFVAQAVSGGLPSAAPAEVGLADERLARISKAMEADVAAGNIPGALGMVIRNGKVAYLETRGMADREAGKPMKEDTIFRIYSMSKPITSVAVMMLFEEARLRIKDPVSKYIPELGGMKVYAGRPNGTHRLEDTKRDMTVQDLLRHTAGLTYGFFAKSAVDTQYAEAGILREKDLAAFVQDLSKIPLKHQPGTRFEYSVATDVLGRLVEVVSGKPLDEFLQDRILGPLNMVDTGFHVPAAKLDRFAQMYTPVEEGGIEPADPSSSQRFVKKSNFFSGGGGLVSTAADYARFCQMMLNGGQLDGVRLLSRKTVDLMRIDHLGDIASNRDTSGYGFGLGFAVATDLAKSGQAASLGEYRWGGAAGTRFWIDPKEQLIGIYMVQILPHNGLEYGNTFKQLTYQSIAD
jgi:CubicO group peptidase (beta-lactamase class C family)